MQVHTHKCQIVQINTQEVNAKGLYCFFIQKHLQLSPFHCDSFIYTKQILVEHCDEFNIWRYK